MPRVAELFIHKEKQRGCPLLGANRYTHIYIKTNQLLEHSKIINGLISEFITILFFQYVNAQRKLASFLYNLFEIGDKCFSERRRFEFGNH